MQELSPKLIANARAMWTALFGRTGRRLTRGLGEKQDCIMVIIYLIVIHFIQNLRSSNKITKTPQLSLFFIVLHHTSTRREAKSFQSNHKDVRTKSTTHASKGVTPENHRARETYFCVAFNLLQWRGWSLFLKLHCPCTSSIVVTIMTYRILPYKRFPYEGRIILSDFLVGDGL
jgi:hypothetical protein